VRILLLSQYFTPEVTAAPVRLHPFAAGLVARGHHVEVICEVPSHPRGVIQAGYGGRFIDRRRLDGFEVSYVWTRASPSRRARDRLASYASYAMTASVVGALRRSPDAIFASSPPLSVGALGTVAAARHRVPWVFDVRDLWPEAAVVLGELDNPRAVRVAEWLERRLYASATAITTPTEPFREHIVARCDDASKVHVLANGTTRRWLEAGSADPDREGLGLPDDRFVWTYAGNVGLSQDLDTAVAAAGLLGGEFLLLIVGEGPARARLEQLAAELAPGSVRFTGLVEASEAARLMRASNALLVSLAPAAALGKAVPIKLYDCCAIGRPIVLAAPGEPRRIAERDRLALIVDPGEPAGLAEAVRSLRDDRDLAQGLAANARSFAARHLREDQLDVLESVLVAASRQAA